MASISPFDHAGSGWTLWPPHTLRADLNVVEGVRRITADILSVCCIRPGENFVHPGLGFAPDLFQRMSHETPHYFLEKLQQAILDWVAGIEKIHVQYIDSADWSNQIRVEIQFQPTGYPTVHTLTFGYYKYTGPDMGSEQQFLADVHLDGNPVYALR